MNKSILFLSQMNFEGKVPRTHKNMRVEFAQMCTLNADHNSLYNVSTINKHYDVVVLLIPKTDTDREKLQSIDIVRESKRIGDKVLFMQEGPSWIFQDMSVNQQIWHYHILTEVDGILTENETDIKYFRGINPNIPISDITSLMITDLVSDALNTPKEDKVIIGGNFTRWYGGFDSFVTARYFDCPIYAPSMGRRQPNEESFVKHLPYMEWVDWIHKLSEFKYAVHLMPTIAAGTFAMNCGYLGIPCIGYGSLDTQRNIHPMLSVDVGDLYSANILADRLKNDYDFYLECSKNAKENYQKYHSEIVVKEKLNKFFDSLWN
jgi:hypothetical protein